jgi:hypothetical protein
VPRDICLNYDVGVGQSFWEIAFNFHNVLSSDCTAANQDIIAVALRNLRSCDPYKGRSRPSGISKKEVEGSLAARQHSRTLCLESVASPMASRLFPTSNLVATANDQPASL